MPHQHLEEIHEADFLNDLLLEAGFDPQKDDFEELKSDIEPILMDRIMMRHFPQLKGRMLWNFLMQEKKQKH